MYWTTKTAIIKFIMRIKNRVRNNFVLPKDVGVLISPGKIELTIGTKISRENPLITSDTVVSNNALTKICMTVS